MASLQRGEALPSVASAHCPSLTCPHPLLLPVHPAQRLAASWSSPCFPDTTCARCAPYASSDLSCLLQLGKTDTRVRAQLPSLSQLQAERIPSPRVGNSGSITLPHCSRPLALQAEAHSMLKLRPLPQTQAPLLRCVQEQLHAPRQVLNSPPP